MFCEWIIRDLESAESDGAMDQRGPGAPGMMDDTLIGLIHVTPKTHPRLIKSVNTTDLCRAPNEQKQVGHALNALVPRALDHQIVQTASI